MKSESNSLLEDRFVLFSFLWALTVLLHQGRNGTWLNTPVDAALSAAALLVLWHPRSAPLFLAMCALQLPAFYAQLPSVSNHWLMSAVMNLAIIVHAVYLRITKRLRGFSGAAIFASFRGTGQLLLVAAYFCAAFQKLNVAFLSPSTSCAAQYYLQLRQVVPFLPDSLLARKIAILGTLLAEGGIPILLLSRRFRMFGLALCLAFHFVLTVEYFYDFTAAMYALASLFAPAPILVTGKALLQRIDVRRWLKVLALVFGISVVAVYASASWTGEDFALSARVFSFFLFGWAAILLQFMLAALFAASAYRANAIKHEPEQSCRIAPLPSVFALLVPAFVVVNALSPHLGFKTLVTLAMYSNLRTEGGYSNHLIIPVTWQRADFQRDLVEIKQSDDAQLGRYAENGVLLPWIELCCRAEEAVAAGNNFTVSFLRGTSPADVHHDRAASLLGHCPSVVRKFFRFQVVLPHGAAECRW